MLLASLLAAFLLSREADVRQAPLFPSETTAMVALDLSGSIGDFRRLATVLKRVAREEERAGLVVFSGGAYELLPPETPARELGSYARFFTPTRTGGEAYPINPWDVAEFRGGTSVASGLDAARSALEREGISRGAILLASDLDVEQDSESVTEAVVAVRRAGIELRIVPVGALPQHRAFFERLVGRAAFLADEDADAPVATSMERRFGGTLPWRFLLVGAVAVLALAANERLLARLEVRP